MRNATKQTLCSRACANQAAKRSINFTCKVCGNVETVRPCIARNRKTCSRACRTVWIGKTDSDSEKTMEQALWNASIEFQKQVQFATYTVDFMIPRAHLIVECDGWRHKLPDVKWKDKRRDAYLEEFGWQTIRFNAREIRENVARCVHVIESFLP
jgi:very-short-patch-repair endonuclease